MIRGVPVNSWVDCLTLCEQLVFGWKMYWDVFEDFLCHSHSVSTFAGPLVPVSFKGCETEKVLSELFDKPTAYGLTVTWKHKHVRMHSLGHFTVWSTGCCAHGAVSKSEPLPVEDLRAIIRPERRRVQVGSIYELQVSFHLWIMANVIDNVKTIKNRFRVNSLKWMCFMWL